MRVERFNGDSEESKNRYRPRISCDRQSLQNIIRTGRNELGYVAIDRFNGRHLSSSSSSELLPGFRSPLLASKNEFRSSRNGYVIISRPIWWRSQIRSVEEHDTERRFYRPDSEQHRRSVSGDSCQHRGLSVSCDSGKRRCHWITPTSDPVYVAFHDNIWGVPIYDERLLFEMLVLSGMLSEYNWTQILTNRDKFREIFSSYDVHDLAAMDEKKILRMAVLKKVRLSESRIRSIIHNSKCVLKVEEEYRSFSTYMWGFVSYEPILNAYKYPKDTPRRTRKAEAISNDLVKRGFRFVGPTIILSFMQASGMTVDHLTDCFRYEECARLSHDPRGLLNMHFDF